MTIKKSSVEIMANPKAVIAQFLSLPGNNRVVNVIERVQKLTEEQTAHLLQKVMNDFGNRHRNLQLIFTQHLEQIQKSHAHLLSSFSEEKKALLGAFFTKEYSIQSAALFNPSIVPHPDQHNVKKGEQRFIMSMRATGEGHISSIVFQTGILDANNEIHLDETSVFFTPLQKTANALYSKEFLKNRIFNHDGFDTDWIDRLPSSFTVDEAIFCAKQNMANTNQALSMVEKMTEIFDADYELERAATLPLSECVIFPNAKSECMGMEDVRLVPFLHENKTTYYGTYTAYDGMQIKSKLIETDDFFHFKIRTLQGAAISDKGMALFPEMVNGKYAMIARQGGETINIMFSNDLYRWDEYQTLLTPQYEWELVQLGNCGSPIKTEKGWLLLTHGVGMMRTYVIS
ncbi:MAG: glycosidase, partial [Bacteroidota bacterium]|nr:glycosidase [Bacteroidota bacterium]